MNRRSPKRWARPRSRRWRQENAPPFTHVDIIKDVWSNGWERPDWAKTARKFGWITLGDYYAIRPTKKVPGLSDLLYQQSPFFQMLSRKAGWAP